MSEAKDRFLYSCLLLGTFDQSRTSWLSRQETMMKLALYVLLMAFSVKATDENFCAGKEPKNYADPADCTRYYACGDGGITYSMSCPAGLWFSEAMDRCDWPQNVDCQASTEPVDC